MKPNQVGRILGIGTRVAVGKLRDGTARAAVAAERAGAAAEAARVAAAGSGSEGVTEARGEAAPGQARAATAEGGRRLAQGAGRFGAALWKPFAHATGQLTLQVTGLLFGFFALGFGAKCWQLYKAAGWRDHHLPLYLGFAALFCWFAVSSFWRAGRKQRQG